MQRIGLQVWNERYREMYGIDPKQIWTGCTIRDLLKARIAAEHVSARSGEIQFRAARGDQARQGLRHHGRAR